MEDKRGKVYLVGGGPGDTGLMTLRGAELLREADVVIHDRLIGEEIIAMIPEGTEKIDVGKNAGDHPVPQDRINALLLEEAAKGRTVVRLKGGDPFVFGRGGEELELLQEEGIDFEVVPGITAAIAAAAYAGIPVTHRDYCSSLHFITGHAQSGKQLEIDFDALTRLEGTLIFFMSVATSGMIADGLLKAGMDPSMLIAIVENGTRSDQRVFVQQLSELAETVMKEEVGSPALIIVGRVCELSDRFEWYEKLPLKGRTFLVTRPESGDSRLARGLRRLGAKAIVRPMIRTSPIRPLEISGDHDVVVFTSAAGVRSFCTWLLDEGQDMRWFAGIKIACIGSATAAALREYGISADFVPSVFSGQALGEEMISEGVAGEGSRVLLLRTDKPSRDITEVLYRAGIDFADIPVYRTEILEYDYEGSGGEVEIDVITFTSRSCVEGYVRGSGDADFGGRLALCIGEKTAEAARAHGFDVVVSDEATIESMLRKAVEII